MNVSVLGIDLVKSICSIVGLNGSGAVVRQTLIGLAAKLSPCIVAMEACVGPHRLGRIFAARGHEVRLMSPEYVRPMVRPDGACCQWRRT
jgi:transposase